MQLLAALLGIAFALAIIVGYLRAVYAVNAHCLNWYGYHPISWSTMIGVFIAYVIAGAGVVMANDDPANLTVGICAAILVAALLFLRIAKKTSLGVAIVSLPMLAVAGAGVGVIALLAIGFFSALFDDDR